MSQGRAYKRVSRGKAKRVLKVLRTGRAVWLGVPRMDPAAPPAAAPPAAPAAAPAADPAADPAAALPGQALAQAPALAQINGQEGARNER